MRIRKVIFPLVIALALVASVGAAGAWFHDEEMVGVGDINAGTLNLEVDSNDPCTQHITISNIAPGWIGGGKGVGIIPFTWTLKNTGSISGKVSVEFSAIKNYDNGCNEPESDTGDPSCGDPGTAQSGELGQYLKIKAYSGQKGLNYANWDFFGFTTVNGVGGHTYDISTHGYWDVPYLRSNESVKVNLLLQLPIGTGNIVQSDSVEFDITFHLDQCNPYVNETS